MNEESVFIGEALGALISGKFRDGTTNLNDDAVRWYAAMAVKIGKATFYAHTTEVKPDIPTEVIVEEEVIINN